MSDGHVSSVKQRLSASIMGNILSKWQARKQDTSSKTRDVKINTASAGTHHESQASSPTATASPTTPTDGEGLPGTSTHDHDGSDFVLLDKSIDEPRPLKVVCIGAGFSGVMCGIRYVVSFRLSYLLSSFVASTCFRFPQRMRNLDFTIYERNSGVGEPLYMLYKKAVHKSL